ncbi:MAG: ATP-binding protein [Desulfoprunum sp.]|nr:hypothetical protein JT06_09015 [Desulfobulbus sp. Tol-SR]
MRQKKLVWHIFPSFLAAILLCIVAVTWYASASIQDFFLAHVEADLMARAGLVRARVERLLADPSELRSFCVQVGRESVTRITVISPDGRILADSNERPESMENHLKRPEIVTALAGGTGQSLRFSRTLNESMLYVAIPIRHATTGAATVDAVLRLAVPVTSIDRALAAIQMRIGLGSIVVIVVAGLIVLLISRRISRPFEGMKQNAEDFARGDFSRKMQMSLPDSASLEVVSFAASMDRMAEMLDDKITTIETHRKQLDAVFSSMIEAVVAIDKDERVIGINAAAARLLGVDAGEAPGKFLQAVVRNIELQDQIGGVLSSGEPVENEIVFRDREGEKLLQVRIVSLHAGRAKEVGALAVINDVTKLRRLETIRRDFVANVSHELRTPITSIRGYVETLLDGAIDNRDVAVSFLQTVLRQSERLNAIIDDLLALSRIEQESRAGGIDLREGPLGKVLEAAVQTCRIEAEKAGVGLVVDCPEGILATMNDTLLEQAIVNLVVNAIRYSRSGEVVSVAAASSAGEGGIPQVAIAVRDTGCGIAPKHLPRLFERFYRSDQARSRAEGGTGLGLAIVKHIVQAHGGTIDVRSQEGIGSEFIITLEGRTA